MLPGAGNCSFSAKPQAPKGHVWGWVSPALGTEPAAAAARAGVRSGFSCPTQTGMKQPLLLENKHNSQGGETSAEGDSGVIRSGGHVSSQRG